ncbi:unnamed protein product [Enterobius vermicularis]|uniref:FZ domain-containing protein n=1 Tax=Enterobius vermicularis TaxID=51028 RepID=A0A0N4V9E9_ENTVE|nr:unnamed protein product [Enterobius vermicularis]
MAFTERCEQYNRTVIPESCTSRRDIIAHECFAACLRIGKNYYPPTHCPEMVQNDDWCIGPEVPRAELPMAKRDLSAILGLK